MKEQFCTYEIAKQLKSLGFEEKCLRYFINIGNDEFGLMDDACEVLASELDEDQILAPLWQQIYDWFKIKHNLGVVCGYGSHPNFGKYMGISIINTITLETDLVGVFNLSENSNILTIEKLIEIFKNKEYEK